MFPTRTLSNLEIAEYYKKEPRFAGCFSRDNLPRKIADKFYVVNLDSKEGPGTHWTLVFNVPVPDDNPDLCIYCDPYGISPPPEVLKFMKTGKRPMVYVSDQYQGMESSACGWFVLFIANKLLKSVRYGKLFDGLLKENEFGRNEREVMSVKNGRAM